MRTALLEWVREMVQRFDEKGIRGLLYVPFTIFLSIWFAVTSRYEPGQNVFEEDWDLLVVLDACRVDALRAVADEYEFVDEVETRWSVGSQSAEWIAKTFGSDYCDYIQQTTYISGNGYSETVIRDGKRPPVNNTVPFDCSTWDVVDDICFSELDFAWSMSDETYGVVLPRVLTDRTIRASREGDQDRLIVHYMQPHLPYIGTAVSEQREPVQTERDGYEALETGEATRDEVYSLYRETLRYVLDDVELLLDNVDAERVVITSDHGEAFGELGVYGHPEGLILPVVKRVPWVTTSATDRQTHEPEVESDGMNLELQEHLRDLGYR